MEVVLDLGGGVDPAALVLRCAVADQLVRRERLADVAGPELYLDTEKTRHCSTPHNRTQLHTSPIRNETHPSGKISRGPAPAGPWLPHR